MTEISAQELAVFGLQPAEGEVYIALLQHGPSTVAALSKSVSIQRTNLYDSLEHLQQKGVVTVTVHEGTKTFAAVEPKQLLVLLDERRRQAEMLIAALGPAPQAAGSPVIQVFKGLDGVRNVLNRLLREATVVIGKNATGRMADALPLYTPFFFQELVARGITARLIASNALPPLFDSFDIRNLPREFCGVTTTICYNQTILYMIWDPQPAIISIESKEVADAYRLQFELLWPQATPLSTGEGR